MAGNDFQYGGWNYYTVQCRTIMTLISSGDCILQCGTWLWNHDSEFTKWQHPAMWQVAVEWHAMEFAQTSAILEFYFWFRFWPYHRSRHVILHQSAKFYPNRTTVSRTKMTSCRFSRWRISASLGFRGPIMDCWKALVRLPIGRQWSSTMALNWLVFEKSAFLYFDDRQTDRQTNRWTAAMH